MTVTVIPIPYVEVFDYIPTVELVQTSRPTFSKYDCFNCFSREV